MHCRAQEKISQNASELGRKRSFSELIIFPVFNTFETFAASFLTITSKVHVRLAIGPPLHLPRIENPTREEVEKHRKRCEFGKFVRKKRKKYENPF